MRYLRNIYFPKNMFENKIERLEFAPVTILCGNEKSKRSEILEYIYRNIFNEYLDEDYQDSILHEDTEASSVILEWIIGHNIEVWDMNNCERNTVLWDEFSFWNTDIISIFDTDEYNDPILPMDTLIERYFGIAANSLYYEYDYTPEDFSVSECIQNNRSDFRNYNLCFLDLPEFGLSIDETQELVKYIEECARLYSVQFVIATESTVIASIKEALIYDMDDDIVKSKEWKDVGIVKKYYKFFNERLNNTVE